jgi:hypothetical protein
MIGPSFYFTYTFKNLAVKLLSFTGSILGKTVIDTKVVLKIQVSILIFQLNTACRKKLEKVMSNPAHFICFNSVSFHYNPAI